MTEYEIIYDIRRYRGSSEEPEMIGFGTSNRWRTPDECAHMVASDIQNYIWETSVAMPDPDEIKQEVES